MQTEVKRPALTTLPLPPPGKTGWPWTDESPPLPEKKPDGAPWPRISIVTPSYNQGQFIEETIRSVLLQGYPNLEYIIIDGGSTDGSVEIIQRYEPWLTYWCSEPDRGQSHAINKGFSRASGDWVGWLNSDDCYAPSALGELMACAAREQANFVSGWCLLFNESDCSVVKRQPLPAAFEPGTLRLLMAFDQPACLWTSELFKQFGPLEESLHYVFDWLFFLKCSPHLQPVISQDTIAFYRHHPTYKTGTGGRKRLVEIANIYDQYLPGQYRKPYRSIKPWLPIAWGLEAARNRIGYRTRIDRLSRIGLNCITAYVYRLIKRKSSTLHPFMLRYLEISSQQVEQIPMLTYCGESVDKSLDSILTTPFQPS